MDTLALHTIEVGPDEDSTEDLLDTIRQHPDMVYLDLKQAIAEALSFNTSLEVRVRTFHITKQERPTIIPPKRALVPNEKRKGYSEYTPPELEAQS